MRFLQLDEADLDNLTQIANLHDDLVFIRSKSSGTAAVTQIRRTPTLIKRNKQTTSLYVVTNQDSSTA